MMNDVDLDELNPDNESVDTMLTLDVGTSAAAIAGECRDAALQFINESKRWGKPELDMWLSSRYTLITKHAMKRNSNSLLPVPLLRDIDARLIERILVSARTEILETMTTIAQDGSASFVLRALIAGTVVRCEDSGGLPAWAPTGDAPRLADRVLSLFAVDYLARPGDYETDLFVCSRCETVTFDEAARRRGACNEHNVGQSITAPRRNSTMPYPPQPPVSA